jgi:S1-C subfamily serine protease
MGLVLRVACALLIVGLGTASAEPPPQQKIALTAKPSVVRVWGAYVATYELMGRTIPDCCAVGGSGTGFFITSDGYIATNAHVVADIFEGEKVARARLDEQMMQIIDRAVVQELGRVSAQQRRELQEAIKLVNLEERNYVVLPNGEKLQYEVVQYGKPGSGRDAAIIKVKIDNAPALPIGDSTRTQVADPIVVIGYPGVADMKELLDEKSQLQATVTDGTVSSLKHATSGEQILQISAPITHGNSGGPALDMKGNVIGLATFGNESEIQGFNFLVASATLSELVRAAKLEPKPSKTLAQWRSGLDHFWRDEYTPAITNFREVETLFPMHSETGALIRQSNEAIKEGKEKKPPSNHNALIIGLVIGGFVVVGGVGALMLARRGKKAAPQQSTSHVPHAQSAPAPHMQPGLPHAQSAPTPHMQPGLPHAQSAPTPGHAYPPQQHYPPPPGHAPPGHAPAGHPAPQFAPPQQMYGRVQPQAAPPMMPPAQHGAPMHGPPMMPGQQPPMMPGQQPPMMPGQQPPMMPGQQPIAKTIAIQGAHQSGGIAPTAFGSLSIGSLQCTRGSLQGQRFALTATGIIIGRQPGVAHVLVNDHRASGKHVWIGIDQGKLVAIDQGTTNGTYINDVMRGRITRAELRDGDVVIVSEPDCLSLQIRLS